MSARAGRSARWDALSFLTTPPVLDAPTNLAVTAVSSTAITLSWTAPLGSVDHYQIERSQSLSGPFTVIGTSASATFGDTTVSSANAYLYRVRAVDSFGAPSAPSNMAVGTAIAFTDDPLVAGVTVVKAQHLNELRQAVNAVRRIAGLADATWTDSTLVGTTIKAVHVQELRDRLGEALAVLSVSAVAYTDPTLATGTNGTLVKKVHVDELRQRSTRRSSSSSGPVDSGSNSASARLDPTNRTGGEDPLSRNFNWGLPVVGLSGRAGLDLGLSLAYNSLATWTRSGAYISFDDDRGFPGAGFRLGFPVIQAAFYNSQASKYSFLMVTPSGSRIELRQVGTSNLYQAVDSSYLLLDASTMILRTTDGTQLSYGWMGNDYQCTQIKDRNGNYVSINYDSLGRIDTVLDTLSRTIKFNYDANGLSTITQTWTVNGVAQTHNWASFAYSNLTIQTSFTGLTVLGPQNGSTLKVLTQVTLDDGSRFNFDYTSWGQVWKVSNYAADSHLLNYRSYNLRGSPMLPTGAETDCPRFTERHDLAENWNKNTSGVEQEVVTTYAVPTSTSWTMPDGTPQTGTVAQVTLPDGTYHKLYSHSSGWDKGLTMLAETYDSGAVKQRWAATSWIQDDVTLAYVLNPRVTETNVYDPAGNRARTTVSYATFNLPDGTSCRYPQDVYEYQADASTVLRRSHTDYNLDATYTNRRIIGLPSAQYLCDGAQGAVPCNDASGPSLFSKVTLQYDEAGSVQGTDAPVQHDNTNYTAGFVAGRANLSSVKRYDVTNIALFTVSSSKYNTAGAVVSATDPLNHQVTVSYSDAFSANGTSLDPALSFVTLAYPTTVTDADGYSSSVRYNYDFGAATWKQTPQPNTTLNLPGPQRTFAYDSVGRIQRVTNLVNNAYTRYEYPLSQNRMDTYATIQEGLGEAHSFKITDGHGRVIAAASDHPGSVGGFSGQLVLYDNMGRSIKKSNPAETNAVGSPSQWAPAGDDAVVGWLYTQQTYDWKGRPLVTTNTDNTTKSASYSGCGCAGGEAVTLTDEVGRQRRVYSDVLGRAWKTEILNWDSSVYSTTESTFNARDQVTLVRQFQGTDQSSVYQDTTMSYDGYGRLQTKHVPEQNAGTATVYSYNPDDTVYSVTDARGASATYGYNNRHQVTGINYSAPAGITPTANVSFGYDAAGNRSSMTDGSGSCSYSYDQLSRMASETHYFSDLGLSFALAYAYNLGDQVTSVSDPFGSTLAYTHDQIGQLTRVDSSGSGAATYATGMSYRAFGGLKHLDYGNSLKLDMSYNNRLLNTQFEVTNSVGSRVAGWQYQYGNDGQLGYSHDLRDDRLDRSYTYDHGARLVTGWSGSGARGDFSYPPTGPYKQTYGFDVWGNLTDRSMRIHGFMGYPSTSYYHDNYVNNRNVGGSSPPWIYDADGRLTDDRTRQYSFDTAANEIYNSQNSIYRSFDGNGEVVKKTESGTITYFLRSSVLGEVIAELNQYGQKQRGYVYRDGEILAKQEGAAVLWNHDEPSGTSSQWTNSTGGTTNRVEMDPLETQVDENGGFSGGGFSFNPIGFYGDPSDQGTGCAAGTAGVACTIMSKSLAWKSFLTFGRVETRTGTKQIQVFNPRWETRSDMRKTVTVQYQYSVYVNIGAFFRNNWLPPVGPDPPQEPAVGPGMQHWLDVYKGCVHDVFGDKAGSIVPPHENASDILTVADREHVDETLLAVTWWAESIPKWNYYPDSNPRWSRAEGAYDGADVGPLQIANNGVYARSPFTDEVGNPFGTLTSQKERFSGVPFDNLVVGARAYSKDILPRAKGRADAAGLFRAGTRTGPGYSDRVKEFNKLFRKYDKFFKCLKGRR